MFTARRAGSRPATATRLAGLTIPGLANCHSHAFHRALRGRTQRGRGTFWTWREQMYAVAATPRPGHLLRARPRDVPRDGLGRHHQRRGVPLPAPRPGRHAVRRPERDGARARRGGRARPGSASPCWTPATSRPGSVADPRACRCGSATVTPSRGRRGSSELESTSGRPRSRVGCGDPLGARRAPRPDAAGRRLGRSTHDAPLHVHLSEQVAENDACLAAYGATPDRAARRGRCARAAHQRRARDAPDRRRHRAARRLRHVTPASARPPSATSATASARRGALHDAGSPLTLGSDSHAVVDLFEEMRAVELDERLATQERGHWSADELLAAGDVRRAPLARLRRRRPHRGRGPRRPGHARHRQRAHGGHRRGRGDGGVRGLRAPTSSRWSATVSW